MTEPQPTPIRAILFDLGGVILRTDQRAPRSALAARFGMTYEEIDRLVFSTPLWKQVETGAAREEQAWAEVGRTLGLDEAGVTQFQKEFFAGDVIDETLVALIRALRGADLRQPDLRGADLRAGAGPVYRVGLLSNNWIADLRGWLERRYGLGDLFDDVVSSAQVGLSKPDPAIYLLAAQRLGAQPQQAVFIDDAPANVAGARAAGMHAISFVSTPRLLDALAALLGHPLPPNP